MNTVHREVPDPGGAKRAAIANSSCQDSPCERKLIAIPPDRPGYLKIVIWLYVTDAVWRQTHPAIGIPLRHGLFPCVGQIISYNRLAKIKPNKTCLSRW